MGLLTLRRALRSAPLIFLLSVIAVGASAVDEEIPLEYQVKAAFVFNFARFVTWPAGAFASADSPLVIGLLGHGPLASALQKTLDGKTVEGRPLSVKQVESAEGAHILVISPAREDRLPDLLKPLVDRPVLTVSETKSFLKCGGMIRLGLVEDKVRFSINAAAVEKAGLTVSSQMLQYASPDPQL